MKSREGTAKRYARALHAVAREAGGVESVGNELAAFLQVFSSQPQLQGVLLRPWIKPAERQGVAREVARASGAGKTVQDFVGLVASRRRMDHLPEMVAAYRALVDEDLGRAHATVRTAVPLTEEQKRQLGARLGQALGKQVVVEETVDRTLLGGFVAQVGSFILDGSLDGQLARMRERLVRG